MHKGQSHQELTIFNPDSDTVTKNIRRRISTLWTHLEDMPPKDHSSALNQLAGAENAAQLFAFSSPEIGVDQPKSPIRRILEPFYSWHEWKWDLPRANLPLVALFSESATARGLRNRKAIVREMEIACVNSLRVEAINLLSIGGGATPALREMMELVTIGGHVVVLDRDVLTEKNPVWVNYLPAAWQYEVWCSNRQRPFSVLANKWRPHVVEMVGMGDCASNEKLDSVLSRIHELMPAGGWLIAGSVDPGFTEKQYLHRMVRWPEIIYRSQEELQQLLAQTGFDVDHVVSVQEPCGVCNIVAITR